MTKPKSYSYEERINREIYRESLWKRIVDKQKGKESKDDVNKTDAQHSNKLDFFKNCMNENLFHARHVENERLTFNSFFVGLTAGTLAFLLQIKGNKLMAIIICSVMILCAILNILLTYRWNFCYRRHMFYAKQCYKTMHIMLFDSNDDDNLLNYREHLDDGFIDIGEYPAFCFDMIRCIGGLQSEKIKTSLFLHIFSYMLFFIWIIVLIFCIKNL